MAAKRQPLVHGIRLAKVNAMRRIIRSWRNDTLQQKLYALKHPESDRAFFDEDDVVVSALNTLWVRCEVLRTGSAPPLSGA